MAVPKGFKHSEETKRKIGDSLRGRVRSDEFKRKASLARIGKSRGAVFAQKMSQIMRTRTGPKNSFFGKHHSAEARERMRQKKIGMYVGSKSVRWKGGITPPSIKIRMSRAAKAWRILVFQRDNYTCQFCGKRGGTLNADHIKSFASFPELRFEVSNGRTLCVQCHRKTETYGYKTRKLNKVA